MHRNQGFVDVGVRAFVMQGIAVIHHSLAGRSAQTQIPMWKTAGHGDKDISTGRSGTQGILSRSSSLSQVDVLGFAFCASLNDVCSVLSVVYYICEPSWICVVVIKLLSGSF